MTTYLIVIFASFLVTYYVTTESLSGLWGCLDKFRKLAQVTETTADIVSCPFCFSIYAAVLVYAVSLFPIGAIIVEVLAVAGAVCLIFALLKVFGRYADAADWYSVVAEDVTSSGYVDGME